MIYFRALERRDWEWFRQRTHAIMCEDSQGIVAHDETGTLLAACVADSFGADSCNVHMAIDKPTVLRRGFLNEVAHHLFVTCGKERVFGLVPEDNSRALKFNRHLGFTEVARVPEGYATGCDYVVMCLRKADCDWLEKQAEAA